MEVFFQSKFFRDGSILSHCYWLALIFLPFRGWAVGSVLKLPVTFKTIFKKLCGIGLVTVCVHQKDFFKAFLKGKLSYE